MQMLCFTHWALAALLATDFVKAFLSNPSSSPTRFGFPKTMLSVSGTGWDNDSFLDSLGKSAEDQNEATDAYFRMSRYGRPEESSNNDSGNPTHPASTPQQQNQPPGMTANTYPQQYAQQGYPPSMPGSNPQQYAQQPQAYASTPPQQTTNDPYSQQQSNPYGQQQGNPYGQQQGNPYGQQQANPYGQQQANPYGQQQANPYGQQQANPYGQQQQLQPPSPFGQPQSPYPQQQPPNPYPQQMQQPPNPYAQQQFQQPPNAFGQQQLQQPPNPYAQSVPPPTAMGQQQPMGAIAQAEGDELPEGDIEGATMTDEMKAKAKASHTAEEEASQGGKLFRTMMEKARQKAQLPPSAIQQQQQQPNLQLPPNAMDLSVEEQARLFREIMLKQQQAQRYSSTSYAQQQLPNYPYGDNMQGQNSPYLPPGIGFDGRKIGRNRDADIISTAADVYFAKLKLDSKTRNVARYAGDDEKANSVFHDPKIQEIKKPPENPHLQEQRESERDLLETSPEEMLIFQGYGVKWENQERSYSGISYKEKIAQKKAQKHL